MNTINTFIINDCMVWTNPGEAAEGMTVIIDDTVFDNKYNHMALAYVHYDTRTIYVNNSMTKANESIINAALSHEVGHIRRDAVYIMDDQCQHHIDACEYAADRYAYDKGYDILAVLEYLSVHGLGEFNARIENLKKYINKQYCGKTPLEIMLELGHGATIHKHVSNLSNTNLLKLFKLTSTLRKAENNMNYNKDVRKHTIAITSFMCGIANGISNKYGYGSNTTQMVLGAFVGGVGMFTLAKYSAKKGFLTTVLLSVVNEINKRGL